MVPVDGDGLHKLEVSPKAAELGRRWGKVGSANTEGGAMVSRGFRPEACPGSKRTPETYIGLTALSRRKPRKALRIVG